MILAMPPEWKGLREELTAKVKKAEVPGTSELKPEDNKDDGFIGVQAKYMEFINSLTKEERIQVRNLFCYDRFSIKQWNDIHKASDGKLNEPPKKPTK